MTKHSQKGVGLLSLVVALSIFAFTFVAGYSALMTRQYAKTISQLQTEYLDSSAKRLASYWRQNAFSIDGPNSADLDGDQVFIAAGNSFKYQASVLFSNRLTDLSDSKLTYRNAVIFFPTEEDKNTPVLGETFDRDSFISTGKVPDCVSATCASRQYRLVNGLEIERGLKIETSNRLSRIALKAQAYFKARMLQNPERTISVNYFYKPSGDCIVNQEQDLGCFDIYTQIASVDTQTSAVVPSSVAMKLGLGTEEMLSAWGQPFEISNTVDSNTSAPPFSMVIRAKTPSGDYLTISAIQQL